MSHDRQTGGVRCAGSGGAFRAAPQTASASRNPACRPASSSLNSSSGYCWSGAAHVSAVDARRAAGPRLGAADRQGRTHDARRDACNPLRSGRRCASGSYRDCSDCCLATYRRARRGKSQRAFHHIIVHIHRVLNLLENLQADVGISYLDNEPLGRVTAIPLYREQYHLVCADSHALADQSEMDWSDFASVSLCLLTPDMQHRGIIRQRLHAAGDRPGAAIQSNSLVALIAHVEAGGWATVLPRQLAEFLALGRALRSIPIREKRPPHLVGLIPLTGSRIP